MVTLAYGKQHGPQLRDHRPQPGNPPADFLILASLLAGPLANTP